MLGPVDWYRNSKRDPESRAADAEASRDAAWAENRELVSQRQELRRELDAALEDAAELRIELGNVRRERDAARAELAKRGG